MALCFPLRSGAPALRLRAVVALRVSGTVAGFGNLEAKSFAKVTIYFGIGNRPLCFVALFYYL